MRRQREPLAVHCRTAPPDLARSLEDTRRVRRYTAGAEGEERIAKSAVEGRLFGHDRGDGMSEPRRDHGIAKRVICDRGWRSE